VTSTTAVNGPAVTRMMLTRLAAEKPDAIVYELGDGILGAYGVEAILKDSGVRDSLTCLMLCANDPVSAWGGIRLLREEFDLEADLVSGPATDNVVGREIIGQRLGLPAINAVTDGNALGDAVAACIGLATGKQAAEH